MAQVPSNLIPTRITQLPDSPVASEDGLLLYIYGGNTYKIRAGDLLSVSGVPTSRQVIAGTSLQGGGALSTDVTLSVAPGGIGTAQLASTGVTPGQYGAAASVPVVTIDATGRVTSITTVAVDSSGGVPATRQVIAGTGLTGGGALSSDVTLNAALSNAAPLDLLNTGSAGVSTSIARADHQHPAVDLADDTQVNGLLGLDSGGTARSIVAAAGALLWSGADGLYVGPVGQPGQVPVSGGTGEYTWGNVLVMIDQPANVVYAGPASGPDGPTSFRALVNNDLPASGASAGTYGSATESSQVTVNDRGVVTSAANVTVTPAFSSITGKPATLSGYGITDGQPLDADLSAIAALAGTSGLLKKTAADTWTLDTTAYGTVTAVGATSPLTSTGGTSPSIGMVNQGTATTVLHGNASGNPSFSAVTAADAPTLVPYTAPQDLQEWTGFLFPDTVVSAYDSTTRTVTITSAVAGQLFYYWQGSKYTLGDGTTWTSSAHAATVGTWFISSADGVTFTWAQTPWSFYQLMVAYVYYGATDRFGLRETHGTMPWQAHQEFHETLGTYLSTGGDLGSYALASTTAANRRPTVSSTSIRDEDLATINPELSSDLYTKVFLTSTGVSNFTVETADIVPLLGNNPYYNQFSTPNWVQTLVPNNSYMIVWLVAVPAQSDVTSQKYRYLWIQGQQTGSLAAMQAVNSSSVNVGTFAGIFTEFVFIGKIIIRYTGGNWQLTEVTKLTGTRVSQSSVSGGYLSAVTTDTTLTGSGTGASPLGVNPVSPISGGAF